jgi:hypothetical protein
MPGASLPGIESQFRNPVIHPQEVAPMPHAISSSVFVTDITQLRRLVLIPREGEQRFHGIVNTDSTVSTAAENLSLLAAKNCALLLR